MAVSFAMARNVKQSSDGPVGLVSLRAPSQKQRRVGPGMPAKEAREFEAGIAGRAENRSFKLGRHQIFFKFNRSIRFPIFFIEAYLSIIMHKYSSILTGLAELSSRNRGSRLFGALGWQEQGIAKMKGQNARRAFLASFSDGCKKKFLLDSADQRHLVWGAIAARRLETCEDISCRITPPFPTPHYSVRIVYRTEKK
jgi:hypothetical protein